MIYSNDAEDDCLGDTRARQQEDAVAVSAHASLKLYDFKVMSVSNTSERFITLDVSVRENT